MRSITVFAGLALAAAFWVPRHASHFGATEEPARPSTDALTPVTAADVHTRSVTVPRDSRGQFEVDALVNGHHVGFMVDTGASVIALTARDAAASDLGAVLTLSAARTDDPLQGVVVPVNAAQAPGADKPSHLQQVHAELVSRLPVPDAHGHTHHTMPPLKTGADYTAYIRARTNAWKASRGGKTSSAHGH